MLLQPVVNIGLNARVEIFGRLPRIPTQLPTTLAPGTRTASHIRKHKLVRFWIQVRFAQVNSLGRRYFSTGVKSLADRFDSSQLLVFPALKEIESVTAGGWLFSGYDRVEEDVVEFGDLTCISNVNRH